MVLDYRSLLSHAMLDTDRQTSHHMLTPRGIDIPKQRPTSIPAACYPMPTPPRLMSASLRYVSSRSEDVCKLGSGSNLTGAPAWNGITMSDDLDSAFSGSSLFSTWSQDELRRFFEDEEVDNDLVAAVDNLFCASTADLLIPI